MNVPAIEVSWTSELPTTLAEPPAPERRSAAPIEPGPGAVVKAESTYAAVVGVFASASRSAEETSSSGTGPHTNTPGPPWPTSTATS